MKKPIRMMMVLAACGFAVIAATEINGIAGEAIKTEVANGGTLSPMKKAPVLDGKIEPGEWDNAIRTVNFLDFFHRMMDPRQGATMLGVNGDRLYIAVISELPPRPAKGPFSTAKTRDTEVIWDANAIEMWFDPNRDRRDSGNGDQAFYNLFINTLGTTEDARLIPGAAPDKGWNPDVQSAHGLDIDKKIWTAEISIALKDLGMDPAKLTGSSMGVLISRNYKMPWSQVTAFPHQGAFVAWRHYPRFFFTADEPVVAIQSLGDKLFQAEPDFQLAIRNPGAARTAKVSLHIKSSDMPDLKDEKEVTLPAGSSSDYRFTVPKDRLHIKDIDHSVAIRVESADGKQKWFGYSGNWSHDPTTTIGWNTARRSVEKKWDILTNASPDAALGVSVYPSFNRVTLSANAAMMVADPDGEDADKVSDSAEVSMTLSNGKELAKATLSWDRSKKQTSASKVIELTNMLEDEYTFKAVFNKQPNQPVTKKYLRKKFAFEGNTIGITDTIYLPFKAVEAKGTRVSVVCREYEAGSLGLWKSIKSLDKELLAGPIVLKADGERILNGKTKLVTHKPTAAVFESTAKDAAVTVKSTCVTEMDGCTKVTLTLQPGTRNQELKSLSLEIPLKDSLMPLWHCATTGLRNNPVGMAPQGSGVVWDSAKFPDGNWIGNFKPYLWLGGTDRGLCWFASNDKGWVLNWNEKKIFAPCQEIIRKDGVLTLRVNLVQRPITITEPLVIVFGLMASPGKPMPADWRQARFASGAIKGHEKDPDIQRINFMGSQYWGSEAVFNSAYPRNADLSILDAMHRITGTPGGDLALKSAAEFMKDWTERNFKPDMPVLGKSKEEILHLANLCVGPWGGSLKGYYTVYWDEYFADSSLHPEVRAFQGEWGPNGLVRSRQDFRAYWAAEFVKRGFGLYFDNAFPRRATDTLTSDAYVIPGLGVQGSATIWEQRDYHRRMWNIHKEFGAKGRNRPIQMVHMTNGNIIPYLTWSDSTLDLEWFYGPEPLQSRYGHGLLRAESAGRQTGCYPCALARTDDIKSPEQGRLTARSRFGVMAVHEILAENAEGDLIGLLYDFGYGTPECAVFNYWDENYPVTVSDPEVKTLLLKKGAELMLVVCSWRNNPLTATFTLNTKALGVTPAAATDAEDQLGSLKTVIEGLEQKLAENAKALAKFKKDVEDKKPNSAQGLAACQKAEQTIQASLSSNRKLLTVVENAIKPITYDAAKAQLTVPLEGYGVRIVRLK